MRGGRAGTESPSSDPVMNVEEITRLLPHRYPFLLIDRVVEFEPSTRIVVVKNVTANEPHFQGHFPGQPIMPGVLLCEAMAQAGGLLALGSFLEGGLDSGVRPDDLSLVLTGLENVRFRRPVVPGDQLRIEVKPLRWHRPLWKMRGVATVDGQVAAQADFSAVEVRAETGRGGPRVVGSPVAPRARERADVPASGGGPRADADSPAEPAVAEPSARETRIHPTAVVAAGAQLDLGVEVGPYAVIGPHVEIGSGTTVGPHAVVEGFTRLGRDNQIFQFASVGARPQDLKFRGEESRLEIGDRNLIREFATLNPGTEGGGMVTSLGCDNLLMNYSHVGHDCRIGNSVILVNSVALAGHIEIHDHAIISGLAGIAQFVTIGESAFVGGGSMVVKDVPPFCMVNGDRAKLVGLNIVGLERRGFSKDRISALKGAFRLIFQSKLVVQAAVARVREEFADSPEAQRLAAFVESSKLGVTRP